MASQPPKEESMDWYESVYEVDIEVDVVHQPPTTSEYKVICRVIEVEIQSHYTDTRPTSYVSWSLLHREYHARRDHSHF